MKRRLPSTLILTAFNVSDDKLKRIRDILDEDADTKDAYAEVESFSDLQLISYLCHDLDEDGSLPDEIVFKFVISEYNKVMGKHTKTSDFLDILKLQGLIFNKTRESLRDHPVYSKLLSNMKTAMLSNFKKGE